MDKQVANSTTTHYPPVVSVLGHVDHGKTTLLDAIRKTNIATREKGGITQKIGASKVQIEHEGKTREITFIDTPGHEAFANMRAQGVSAADIALLVVASDDGIKPQTQESIKKIQGAGVPYIVVITKIDLETARVERVKQHLLKEGVMLEGLGGEVPYIGVSAKTGKNIRELLDLILLVFDVSGIKKEENASFLGVVIESKMDTKRGNVATIIVKKGTLDIGKEIFSHAEKVGKVRALIDTYGKNVKSVVPGNAVEILGLTKILPPGSVVTLTPQAIAPSEQHVPTVVSPHDLAKFLTAEEKETLKLIIRTETVSEFEAIRNALPENIEIVFHGQGDISVSDILLAKDFSALVIGFNVNVVREAKLLAENEKIFYKTYSLIYELLDEVQEVFESLGKEETPRGRAQILAVFPGKDTNIAGAKVLEGKIALNDKVSVVRAKKELGRGKIVSLRRGKQEVKEVSVGVECGIGINPILDFSPGDMILSHS